MDLGKDINVTRVTIYNRIDGNATHALEMSSRLSNSLVSLRNLQGNTLKVYEIGDATGISKFDISFDSYPGQTSGPTPSPTVFTPCNGTSVEIKVSADNFPSEIAWTLVNKCRANITLSSPPYLSPNKLRSTSACLPTGKYKFTITDSFGDGICCYYGRGGYEILVNGTTELEGAHEGRFRIQTFGACPIVDSYIGGANLVRKVRVELEGQNHLHMREVQVFDQNNINRALNKRATQSSTSVDCGADNLALNAVNGDLTDMSHTLFESGKYWLLYHLLWVCCF